MRAVYASAGYAAGAKLIVPNDGGITPGAGECQVSFDVATGKSCGAVASADAVTECVVEYDTTSDAYAALIGDGVDGLRLLRPRSARVSETASCHRRAVECSRCLGRET